MDLHLQLPVGLLQGMHLVQVGGQTVIQVLHGDLLIAREEATIATTVPYTKATPISSNQAATQSPSKAAAEATTIAAPQPADTPGGAARGAGYGQAPIGAGGPAGASGEDRGHAAGATTQMQLEPFTELEEVNWWLQVVMVRSEKSKVLREAEGMLRRPRTQERLYAREESGAPLQISSRWVPSNAPLRIIQPRVDALHSVLC